VKWRIAFRLPDQGQSGRSWVAVRGAELGVCMGAPPPLYLLPYLSTRVHLRLGAAPRFFCSSATASSTRMSEMTVRRAIRPRRDADPSPQNCQLIQNAMSAVHRPAVQRNWVTELSSPGDNQRFEALRGFFSSMPR